MFNLQLSYKDFDKDFMISLLYMKDKYKAFFFLVNFHN